MLSSPWPSLAKNILYCVLLGITIDSNNSESIKLSSNIDCTFALIVPSSTSPILAVPATVRNPSGPKNIKSPANSCIVSPLTHPIFLVTGVIEKSACELPDNLNILFSQNINKSLRKTFKPTIVSSTLILPPPIATEKLLSSKGTLNTNSWGVLDIPA